MGLGERDMSRRHRGHKPCPRCIDLREEVRDFQCLLDMQRARVNEAVKAFTAETGAEYHPDLGELVQWLMDKARLYYDKSKLGLGKSDPGLHRALAKKHYRRKR